MNRPLADVDFLVLGSGFAGSITATLLRRIGYQVMLVDRAAHPRFAIGESSTPIANMILRDLATRYDVPFLRSLSRYGSWKREHSDLGCGRKRGFSYYHHQAGRPFVANRRHDHELLVAASSADEVSDTQWYRADVDSYLFGQAAAAGVEACELTKIRRIEHVSGAVWPWQFQLARDADEYRVRARFVIDATGAAGVLARYLRLESAVDTLRTDSRAVYGHFADLPRWHASVADPQADDYPFDGDHAAQHHLLDQGGWMWMLRFDNGLTSAGLVLDNQQREESREVSSEWARWLGRYPSLEEMFRSSRLVQPTELALSGRLQRRWTTAAGADWVLLPHTYGFVDPLHSTGIGFALSGIEWLAHAFEDRQRPSYDATDYNKRVAAELDLIDLLVAGCYRSLPRFSLFVWYAMTYFAAATHYEQIRSESANRTGPPSFLKADDSTFRDDVVRVLYRELQELPRHPSSQQVDAFGQRVKSMLQPYNHVGLGDIDCRNMYHYTAAE